MNCTLTLEQQKQFYKKVFKDLSTTVSDNKDFDIKSYILDFYNLVNNKTNDSSLALSYAQLLPENVINVTADDRNIAKYLRAKGVDLNNIYDLRDDFENISSVEKYVSATALTEDKLADIRKKAGLVGSQLEKAAESDPDVDFQAKPATGFTTTGQEELLDENGIPTGEADPDPVKIASYAFTRNLLRNLNATNLSNADTLKLEALNGTEIVGIYLSPIDVVKNGKSIVNLTFKTKVDDAYKQIYLNSDGIVTYIEGQDPIEGSILPISDFRTPSSVSGKADFFKRGTKELTVQSVEEQVESIIDKARKSNSEIPNREQLTAEFQKQRNNEVNLINQMVKTFIKNKNLTIPLSITGGKLGFSLTYGSYIPLSQIKDIADNNINFQFDKSGAAYMKINKYYNLLRVRPDKINSDLASNLSKLLMDKGVSNPQKYLVFEAILNPDDANVRLLYNNTKDVLSLYVNGVQAFDSTIIEDADQDYLTEQLQNAYININKKYFGTSIEIPTYVGENYTPYTIDYTTFIKSNATADATLRNDGSIKQFNPILEYEFTIDALEEIYPTEKKQEPINIKKGVPELFETNPELATIGTPQQYSKYLDSIFSNSKIKDIVYHGVVGGKTSYDNILKNGFDFKSQRNWDDEKSKFKKDDNTGIFFSDYSTASFYGEDVELKLNEEGEYKQVTYKNVIPAILNIKYLDSSQETASDTAAAFYKENKDKEAIGMLGPEGGSEGESLNYVVFEPQQIHILGNKQDIDGFKNFVKEFVTVKPKAKVKTITKNQNVNTNLGGFKGEINLDLINEINNSLKRAGFKPVSVSEEKIKEIKNWYSSLEVMVDGVSTKFSEVLPLKESFSLINSDVLGTFTTAGITLYAKAGNIDYTTLYHEAWHAFSQLLLTPEQKKSLYDTVRTNIKKLNKASDKVVEEYLAEDFREYVLSNGTKVNTKGTENIFQKLWRILKSIFSGQTEIIDATEIPAIKTMYDNLRLGNLFEYEYSLDNVQFGKLNRGIEPLDTKDKGLSLSNSRLLVDSIDGSFAELIDKSGLNFAALYKNKAALEYLYQLTKESFQQKLDFFRDEVANDPDGVNTIARNNVAILEYAIDNFGNFNEVLSGKQKNGLIAYHKQKSKYLEIEAKLLEAEEDKSDVKDIEKFERTGNDLSLKELTSNQTLYLVKSMYEVNKNGTPKYNRLGFNKLVDFNKSWSIISKNLIGSNSFDDIYTRLIALQNQYPPVAQLLSKLGNPENTLNSDTEFNKWIAFTQTFNKTVVPIIEQRLVTTTNPDGTTSISTYIQRATGDISKIATTFKNKFSTSRNQYVTKEKGTNYLNISAVLNNFKTINNTNAFDFLNAIGFYLDDNKAVKSAIENSFDLRYTQTSIQYDYILEALKNAKEKNILIPDPIKYLRSEKGGNQATNVNKILEIQAQYGNADFGSAITNVEGNTEFETQLRNSLTNIVDDLNKLTYIDQMIDDAKYEHLRYYHPSINPYAKHSYIIKSLFDQAGNRRSDVTLSVENLGGLRRDVDGVTISGVKTNKLNIYDKYLYDVHATILGGTPELPRHASKSSSYGVALNKKYTGRTVDNLYLPIRSIAFSSDNGVTEAMPLINNYLMAELERIWYVKNIKSLKNVDTLSKNGDKIVAFDSVLSAETKQSLYSIVNKAKSISDIVINKKLQEDIYKDAFAYFNNQFAENLDIWKDLSTVTNGQVLLSPEVRIKLLKETRVGKSEANKYASPAEQINLIIKTFTFNNWFNNFEMQLFYGDLSQFDHLKEEFHKRNASIASTGEFAIIDRYTLGYLNATSQNSYAKSIDIPTKEFSNKAITTVLDDAQPNSIYYDYYTSLLLSMGIEESKVVNTLKPYKKIKEGDAQGWVTFDFYRNFLRSINKWSQDQENLYNQVINDPESVNPHKVKEFFPVLKASYYGPLKTEVLNVTALHKFSLMPLVPTVVKGTNLEQFHKQLLEQGVDYALYKSGSKISNITLKDGVIPSMYKDLNKRELYDGPYALNGIYLPYFKNQLDIAPYFKENVTLASQLRKIIENNLYESGKPIKKEYSAVVEQYENSVKNYVDFYKNKLFKEVGVEFDDNGNIKKGDPKDLIKAIERELVRLEVPDFQLDILETNEDGTLKNNFDSIINSESIEKQLVAIIERKIVRPKVKGEQLVQVSGSGFEQYGFSKPFGEDILKYGTNGLKFYTVENDKIQPMQVKVALQGDFLKLLTVTYEGSKINTLERLNEAIKNEDWLKENGNLLKMIGVRIPTQGLNSIEYMQVAEFLPAEAGSIIIVPTELVAKSGSDFDIDKLSIVMPNITVLREDLEALQQLYPDIDMSDIITKTANLTKDDTKVQAMENNILSSMISIMELKDNFPQLITPNETDIVKPISEDLAKYNREYNPVSKRANQDSAFKTISPTRALEIRYNLYKHEANNIGKLTIGVGAVSNTYNVILNRVGAFLNDTYEFKDNKGNSVIRKSRLLLPYNDLNGKISLSGLTSEDGAHYISDVISQLMNGWVDIEKDTWVFDMNAIYELAPTMLFMLQAGINVETAAYFLSQPLIRDYIKASRVYNSLYNNALDSSPENEKGRGLLNYKAKRFVIENNDLLGNIFSPSVYEKLSYADKKVLNSNSISKYLGGKKSVGPAVDLFIKAFGKESFTPDDIKNIVSSNDRKSPAAQLAFLHFLEIEEQSKVMIQIARATNVDTRKSGNLFQAQSRITRLEELQEGDRLPKEVVDRIINESPISAFFIQDYLLNIFKDYFPLRANSVINSYISDYISANYNKILNEYNDVDTFISRFRNDILQFIMQNSIGVVDIDAVKNYKGFSLENTDTAPVEKTRGLVKSAAYIDGKIYVDRELLRKEYNQKLYNLDTYGQGTLYSLPKDLSTDLIPYFSTEKQYAGFVLEREFLRGTTERLQDEVDTAFEERIANNALDNIFNPKKIFFTKTSFADQLEAIKTIPGLVEQYSLLEDNLVYDAQQVKKEGKVYTIKNIKLVGDTKDAEFLADMNAQFEELADPSVQKIADPVLNREISYFFNKLSIYGFIQSGMNKSNITFIPILSSKNFKDVMREPVKAFGNILSSDKQKGFSILYNYTKAFNNKSNSYRFKSYVIDSTINKLGKSLKTLPAGISSTLTPRVYNFNLSLKKDAGNTIDHINNYPELVATYGMALDDTGVNNVKIDAVLGNTTRVKGNSIGLPMYKSLLGQPTLLQVADHSENLTIITDVIKHLKESYDSGKSLLFNKEGYSISFDDVNTDKEAYFELFKELYYNFGYLNPKLENNSEFMNYIYSVQPLNQNILEATEEDVEDKNIVADADPLTDPECGPNSIM